ncbi:hypothetical protein ACM66B_001484 [Microbotryomycetes sp. NB124-2]
MMRPATTSTAWSEASHGARQLFARHAIARTLATSAPRRAGSAPTDSVAAPSTSTSASSTKATSSAVDAKLKLDSLADTLLGAGRARSTDRPAYNTARHRQQQETDRVRFNINSSRSARSSSYGQHSTAASTPESIWSNGSFENNGDPVTTTSARSFDCTASTLAQRYRQLTRTLNENNVRKELRSQERFESKSDKRVRLNSERHRRRFKVAVGKAVALAMRSKDK